MIERVILIDDKQVGCQVFERCCLMTDVWFANELVQGKTFSGLVDMLANLIAKDKEKLVLLPMDKVERDGVIDVDFLSDEFSDEIVYVKNCTSNPVEVSTGALERMLPYGDVFVLLDHGTRFEHYSAKKEK